MSNTISFSVSFKGTSYIVSDWLTTATLADLKAYLEELTAIPADGQKLMYKGLLKGNDRTLAELKLIDGAKLIMMGSTAEDLKKVLEADKRIAQSQPAHAKVKPFKPITNVADSQYTFHRIEVIEEFPEPEKARKLLERLRNDIGICGIMKHYKWSVGALTELTPFDRSILGFNRNSGQLISLRLRTDDLEGFRHYKDIRKVLLHELAHNVWGEHDNNFHTLDRQLNKDVISMDWTIKGEKLSNGDFYNPTEEEDVDGGGQTWEGGVYRLGGSKSGGEDEDYITRREKIAQAALLRLTKEEQEMKGKCGYETKGPENS